MRKLLLACAISLLPSALHAAFPTQAVKISTNAITARQAGTAVIAGLDVSTTTISSSTITNASISNLGVSSMTTTLPMSARKITGLANGTASTDAAALGQVITNPAVMFRVATASTTTSTSYVPSNATLSFTPSLASRRVRISFFGTCSSTSVGGRGLYSIFQNGVDLATSSNGMIGLQIVGAVNDAPCSMSVIASPATTSAVTYAVYMKVVASATIGISPDSEDSVLIAEEIY